MSTLKVNTINASTSGQAVDVDIKNPKSFRNKVINGGMLVNQRGNQSSVTTSVYGLDRFKVQEAADVTYDINQSTDTPDGFGNSFHIDIQGAQASPSASHFMQLMTALEGFDVQDFAKGTSGAKQYTVSFYVKTNVTGNYALQITDDNSRSCSQLYTVSDTNWNRYTVTFPADTTGAIDNDNSEGLRLTWHLLVGTDRSSGTMNTTWAATTTANIAAGQNANVASSTSNNWYITGVQLEVGSVATDFEHLSFADELRRCQRYFYKYDIGGIQMNLNRTGGRRTANVYFPTTMRDNGTVTITTQFDDGGATIEADNIRTYGFIFKQASSSASNDAPTVSVFEVSAEL
tara:strand:+ start:939 stop:1976 length:1038 start_codon:yes stop_codon:yes gene_type:complete